jgi:DinB family protein
MNAYVARLLDLLGSRDPLAVIEETPKRLADLAGRIGSSGLERRWGPDKWTARTILAHFADVEILAGFRVRQTLAEENPQIQAIDQDVWARRYGSADPALALAAQAALRRWNLDLFRSLGAAELARAALHPERGEETVDRMIRLLAGHDLNHLAQLETIAGSSGAAAGATSRTSG